MVVGNTNDNLCDYLGNNLIRFKDSEQLELKKKAAVYPNIRNAFNLDFGRDYATMAVENYKNGHLFWGLIQMLDSACEIVYDLAAAYVGAVFVDASIRMEINYLRDAGYHFIETVEKGIECWEVAK